MSALLQPKEPVFPGEHHAVPVQSTCNISNNKNNNNVDVCQQPPRSLRLPVAWDKKKPDAIVATTSRSPLAISLTMSKPNQPLTPPPTPVRTEYKKASASADMLRGRAVLPLPTEMALPETKVVLSGVSAVGETKVKRPKWKDTVPRPYSRRYQLLGSPSTGYQEYGRGAWSIVYRALEIAEPLDSTAPVTPPGSPPPSPMLASINPMLAVKVPSRRDAHKILEKEARILTYLHSYPKASDHLVSFHGFDLSRYSLVLEAIPLNLETYAIAAGKAARLNLSTKTMFDPVIGTSEWVHMATSLIDGLAFIHAASCVHGDIKPANILFRPISTSTSLTPVYCDFSSSYVGRRCSKGTPPHANHDGEDSNESDEYDDEIEPVSAVTLDYASPELIASLYPCVGDAIATPASDVFALATTLIMVAIGESPYAGARMEVQKLGMAKEGRPLDFARGGDGASRIMRGRLVERVVKGGLAKEIEKRFGVGEWRAAVRDVLEAGLEVG